MAAARNDQQQAGAQSLITGQSPKKARTIFTFTLPEDLAEETDIQTVGLVQLKGTEEVEGARATRGDPMRLPFELARKSLKQINGKDLGMTEEEAFWERPANAKVRTLIVTAFNEINQPSNEQNQSFLKSCQVKVG